MVDRDLISYRLARSPSENFTVRLQCPKRRIIRTVGPTSSRDTVKNIVIAFLLHVHWRPRNWVVFSDSCGVQTSVGPGTNPVRLC
jgi:hypothetical protein